MATRLYFPSDLVAPVTVIWDPDGGGYNYDYTDQALRRGLSPTKTSSAFATHDITDAGAGHYLVRQYISPPLTGATEFTALDTVSAYLRIKQGVASPAAENHPEIGIWIVSNDGATIRGKICGDALSSACETVLTNRPFTADYNLDAVSGQAGDRIVVGIAVYTGPGGYTTTSGIEFGDNSVSDLPEDSVSTDQYCPWVKFSQTLLFEEDEESSPVESSIDEESPAVGPALDLIFAGGPEIGGEIDYEVTDPGETALSLIGGGGIGSAIVFNTERPGIRALLFEGGLAAGGINPVDVVRPTAADITLALALTGGMDIGGDIVITNSSDYFDSIPTTELVFQGGIRIGGWPGMAIEVSRLDGTTTRSLILSGGLNIGGDTAIEVSEAPSGRSLDLILGSPLGDGLAIGGELAIGKLTPRAVALNLTGGLVIGGEVATNLQELFETWALTGHEYEPALWTGFHFNSYCVYRGQVYAANDDGVFLLGGTDDDGTVIHPGVRIGPTNYGTDQDKRIRTIRVGGNVDGARVRVANEDGDEEYYDVERGRVTVSKGLQGRELTIDIMDFERLDQFEMVPLVMSKHWR